MTLLWKHRGWTIEGATFKPPKFAKFLKKTAPASENAGAANGSTI